MNKFEKVSFERFAKDFEKTSFAAGEDFRTAAREIYENIKLPKRATKLSAGYDFFSPLTFSLAPGESIVIPTGIRMQLDEDKFLALYPRSGLGFKYRCQLDNSVGIIDADYFFSDNEGHIHAKITNDSKDGKAFTVSRGEAFMQGVITQFFKTVDDDTVETRNGGFGSTTKAEQKI